MNVSEYGTPTRVVTSGKSFISSGNAHLIGVTFHGSGTARVQFFAGATCSSSLTGVIHAYRTAAAATANTAVWMPVPAYCSGGFCVDAGATLDPDLTIYWNPVGG